MRPVPRTCRVVPDGAGERLEGVLHVLERESAHALTSEGEVDDGVRPPADVDDGRRDRLVHRHRGVTEPPDPGPIPERLGKRGPQGQGHVLDRVMVVDVDIARRVDLEVEQRVMGERPEQVVEEANAGVDLALPAPSRESTTLTSVSRVLRETAARREPRSVTTKPPFDSLMTVGLLARRR